VALPFRSYTTLFHSYPTQFHSYGVATDCYVVATDSFSEGWLALANDFTVSVRSFGEGGEL